MKMKKAFDILLNRGPQREQVTFATLFHTFKRILELNNQILERIADMGDKLGGDYIFDQEYIRSSCLQMGNLVYELVYNFNILAPKKYPALDGVFHQIRHDIEEELAGRVVIPKTEYVIPYDIITGDFDDVVGGKNTHIGEIRNRLGMAVPDGFAITTRAYQSFMDHNDLQRSLADTLEAWKRDTLSTEEASRKIQKMILAGTPAPDLTRAVQKAVRQLQHKAHGRPLLLAVRSSAMGEDREHSFAGQYRSFLNAPPSDVMACFKQVLASTFSVSAMEYRRQKGFHEREVVMAVACQRMIDAKVSGVLYSLDPADPTQEVMVISAAWGLSEPMMNGSMAADRFLVSRETPHGVQQRDVAHKPRQWMIKEGGGCEFQPVAEALQTCPSLADAQISELVETALLIERYFKTPQDIEWAYDRQGRLMILQTRPLNVASHMAPAICDLAAVTDRYPVVFAHKGIIVQNGIASGKVFIVQTDNDLEAFPNGAILVAKKTSPRYAKVARKAGGIITDAGSPTGHMAAIAREFRIPTIVNTAVATQSLLAGQEITLDAQENVVYEGRIKELCYFSYLEDAFEETYEYRLLRRLLKKITPLNLVDPHAKNFAARACRSYHDITRFIHEKAVEELAGMDYRRRLQDTPSSKKLDLAIPLDLVIIDIHDGLQDGETGTAVTREQIRSIPMKAFLDGLCAPGVWSREPMSVDFTSFMSSLTRTFSSHLVNPQHVGRNLAVLSENYTNINLRLGYHFNMIDAYIGDRLNDNYAYFRFMGGVTDPTRRSRRARLIYETLAQHDFNVDLRGDLVIGRIKKLDRPVMERKMYLLGQLVGFTRQLDVQMSSDLKIGEFTEQFERLINVEAVEYRLGRETP